MAEIDPVILQLRADVAKYRVDVENTTRRVNASLDSQGKSVQRLEAQIKASSGRISTSLKAIATSLAAGFSAREVSAMADSYTRFTNQLKVAGLEGGNLADVQSRLFQVAQRNGVELESVGTLYSRAAQNQKELGASTEDLIGLTRAVSASLRISGTSTNEASGALLQLGQALGSPRIQAEEFNSLIDTMQPLLREASKYIDGTGNSLSGLTRNIKDTNGPGVSNIELFRAITQAMAALEGQAGKTSLTIAGAFTNLSNAMTKYIGEADAANGASAVLVSAINSLAENLDTVTEAVAVLSAVMLGRFVAGMTAGAASSAVAGTAIFALQARAAGAATTMEALALTSRAAGASMLAAFGGPVGLAVTALAVGIGYLVAESYKAEAAAAALNASVDQQTAKYEGLRKAQAQAAAESDNLTASQRAALTATANLTGEANLLANAWARVAAQAKAASLEGKLADRNVAYRNIKSTRAAYQEKRDRAFAQQFGVRANVDPEQARRNAEKYAASERKKYQEAIANGFDAKREYEQEAARLLTSFKPTALPATSSGAGGGKKKGGSGGGASSAPARDIEAISRRFQDDMAAAQLEIKQAQADAVGTSEARRDLEADRVEEERQSRERQIKADKDLDAAQKQQLLALNDKVAAARRDAISADALAEAVEKNKEAAENSSRYEQDALEATLHITDSRTARLEIERRILASMEREETAHLESEIAAGKIANAEKARADLTTSQAARRTSAERDNASPLEQKRQEVAKTAANMGDAIENIEVDAIDRLTDGLANAATEYVKLGGIAGDVINGIIRDLIKLAAQQAVLAVFGGGEGTTGGIKIPGFATGTNYAPGGIAIVGEKGPELVNLPRGSKVISNNMLNARAAAAMAGATAAGAGARPVQNIINQTFTLDARGGVTTPQLLRQVNEIASQKAAQAAGYMGKAVMKAVPNRVQQYNRDGT